MTAFVPGVQSVETAPVPFRAVERFVTVRTPVPTGTRAVLTAQPPEMTADTLRFAEAIVVAEARKEAAMRRRVATERTDPLRLHPARQAVARVSPAIRRPRSAMSNPIGS